MSTGSARKLLHTRQVSCRGYALDNGLWEIEGRLSDLKTFPMANIDRGGCIEVGEPLQDMGLCLTLDQQLTIHAVKVSIDASPFATCASITDAFAVLKRMRLTPGFHRQAKERLSGVKGCTHLLELLVPIATTAYQTLWQSERGYDSGDPAVTEFLLNSCHALAADGEVVRALAPQLASNEDSA